MMEYRHKPLLDMTYRKDDRLLIAGLGEYYEDLLAIDAFITGNSKPQQGKSLLSAKLNEKETKIRERVTYLAKKRGVEPSEMWGSILRGEAKKIRPDEMADFEGDEE